MKHYLYKKYRREIMQHGYRKSNYCKRIIRRFVVKCGQIKKPPCESKWKIPVRLRDTPCTARERIPSLPGCRPIKQQKWTPLQVNLQGVYFHHFAWLVAFTKFSQKNQHSPLDIANKKCYNTDRTTWQIWIFTQRLFEDSQKFAVSGNAPARQYW